jgi:acetyl-CoA carboxylase carboxyltransferase component
MQALRSRLDTSSEVFCQNRADMLEAIEYMNLLLEEATQGGGEAATQRLISRGKLPVRERVSLLLDPDSPFLEIGPLGGWMTNYPVGGGMLIGIGVVNDVECSLMFNDPTVLGGAITGVVMKKIERALEVSRRNRLPLIMGVESAGADLRGGGGDGDPGAAMRRNMGHFADRKSVV